jgi:hypothetical protein
MTRVSTSSATRDRDHPKTPVPGSMDRLPSPVPDPAPAQNSGIRFPMRSISGSPLSGDGFFSFPPVPR